MSEHTSKRVVLVTGASRGIGRAIAHSFASKDIHVLINYRSNKDLAETVVADILENGGSAEPLCFDIAHEEQVVEAAKQVTQSLGGVDVLINNAGLAIDQLLLRAKFSDWQKNIDTNLSGAFLCSKYFVKSMMKRKNHPRIVFISSIVGQMGNAGQSMYAASKAGMIGMAKSLAKELASRQITVNVVAPGFVKTEMTDALTEDQQQSFLTNIPLKRWADPKEIAHAVEFLCSEKAAYITGQVLAVNGGMYM